MFGINQNEFRVVDDYHIDYPPIDPIKGWKPLKKHRLKLWRQNPHCNYCGKKLTFNESTVDHVIPRSKGGKTQDNVVLACHNCNNQKRDLSVEEFRKLQNG